MVCSNRVGQNPKLVSRKKANKIEVNKRVMNRAANKPDGRLQTDTPRQEMIIWAAAVSPGWSDAINETIERDDHTAS